MSERTQISVFLVNEPGELAKICSILGEAGINIEAMSIQNAKDYVMELLRAREKSGRRVVLAQNYQGILKESSDFSIIRFLVDQPQKAEHLLAEAKYPVDTSQVLCVRLDNKPGQLGMVSRKLADADVNMVMDENGNLIEVQGTAERKPIVHEDLNRLIEMGKEGIKELIVKQKEALGLL